MNKYPNRKPIRLKEYNYTQSGYYCVTICLYNRKCFLGEIIDNNMKLNNSGQMIDNILRTLPEHYHGISIDNYIVMPNHIHEIIIIKPVGDDLCVVPDQIHDRLKKSTNQNNLINNGQTQYNGRIQRSAPTGYLSAEKKSLQNLNFFVNYIYYNFLKGG